MDRPRTLFAVAVVVAACAGSGIARAQHAYDMLVQQSNGQLVTGGASGGQWTLGRRVFSGEFGSDFATNNPGFGAYGVGSPNLPAGGQALPGNTSLQWDFMPMTIDEVSQNLFFWNGADTDGLPGLTIDDVTFGALPGSAYLLSLYDKTNTKYSADGSDTIVTGGNIGETNTDGSLHIHRYFFLEDGDGNGATSPADGIYLIAPRLRMSGLANADPVFIVFGTANSSVAALDDAAVPWVEQQLDLPGDFNQDGFVDAADYVVWRKQIANEADYDVWRAHFGEIAELRISAGAGAAVGQSASSTAAAVPAPAAWLLTLIAAIIGLARGVRGASRKRLGCRTFVPRNCARRQGTQ